MAALLSLIFKNPNFADDDGDEDEEELELAADEAYLHPRPGDEGKYTWTGHHVNIHTVCMVPVIFVSFMFSHRLR